MRLVLVSLALSRRVHATHFQLRSLQIPLSLDKYASRSPVMQQEPGEEDSSKVRDYYHWRVDNGVNAYFRDVSRRKRSIQMG